MKRQQEPFYMAVFVPIALRCDWGATEGQVAELVDAQVSKTCDLTIMRVRFPPCPVFCGERAGLFFPHNLIEHNLHIRRRGGGKRTA